VLQLVGNLVLLVPSAALAALRWPALARLAGAIALWAVAALGIELLQWLLPLDRVVSPADALLNTTGAAAALAVSAALVPVRPRHSRSSTAARRSAPVSSA
jgi:glycopeptide antibiotics resistance protein